MAYHKLKELQEINWQETETFSYADFLADFRASFTTFAAIHTL